MSAQLVGKSGAEIMAEAVKAAEAVLKQWCDRPVVVVNVVWSEDIPSAGGGRTQCAMGSRVPRRYRRMMRESLLRSTEEAQ